MRKLFLLTMLVGATVCQVDSSFKNIVNKEK